jgi:lipopolysaccharide/colanic/teichoic acid biosynthesis glycosyltransferase
MYLFKELIDRLTALIVIVLLSPVWLIIALLIKSNSLGPVYFIQDRVGKNGEIFKSIKFRTMVHRAAETGLGFNIKQDDERITQVGKFLRTWSLDELPQLFNVLLGDMSFVGPRPTLQYQVDLYSNFQKKRLLVKPGITGWAQVNGRNAISWEQRIKLDVWYVENWSLWLDLTIIIKTFKVVIKKEGLYGAEGINDDFLTIKKDQEQPFKHI